MTSVHRRVPAGRCKRPGERVRANAQLQWMIDHAATPDSNRGMALIAVPHKRIACCLALVTLACAQRLPADQGDYHYAEAASYSAQLSGHAVLVAIDGKIVFEEYQNGYTADRATHIYSATKSFWGPAVAAMIADGLVSSYDEKVSDTLSEWKKDSTKSRITIRMLLDLTAGVAQDVRALQGHGSASDMYAHALELRIVSTPGERFQYGPSAYYVLGALIARKVQPRYKDPVDYLEQRIFAPLGIRIADWERDRSGNPHIPNGAYLTARDWMKYGRFLLQGGMWEGRQIVPRALLEECFRPSRVNAGYGLTFWLNRPGGFGERMSAPSGTPAGVIYPDGYPDIYAAMGAGTNDLFVVPSLHMVIVHQSEAAAAGTLQQAEDTVFSRAKFLSLFFTGQAGTMTAPITREFPGQSGRRTRGGSGSSGGRAAAIFDRLDRDGDGRVSLDEVPEQASRLRDNFDRLDRNHDGYLTPDELGTGN
jgi:CubicO group peptidase (beta-lactamase class C family)